MRRVGVVESSAVGAELLDRNLRGSGADGNRLFVEGRRFRGRLSLVVEDWTAVLTEHGLLERRWLKERNLCIRAECLDDSLRNEQHGQHDRQREQDVDRAARKVEPEIADGR